MNALREVEPDSPELVDLLETKERAKGMYQYHFQASSESENEAFALAL